MMCNYEYAITHSTWRFDSGGTPLGPISPDGDGWRLVACCTYGKGSGTVGVLWHWERLVIGGGK
jgi:hypothetical protein